MPRGAKVIELRNVSGTGDSTGQQHLRGLDDDWLTCKGDRHDFPKLRLKPGPLPDGVTARKERGGVYQLIYTCPDCGTRRVRDTLKGGIIDTSVRYGYKHPKGYLAPKGAGLTKSDYAAELAARAAPYVREAAEAQARVEAARRAAQARKTPRPSNQHATTPRARKHIRDSERKMHQERADAQRRRGEETGA